MVDKYIANTTTTAPTTNMSDYQQLKTQGNK